MKELNFIEKPIALDSHRVFVAKTPVGEYRIIYTGIDGWWWTKYCIQDGCPGEEHECKSEEMAKLEAQQDFTKIRLALCA